MIRTGRGMALRSLTPALAALVSLASTAAADGDGLSDEVVSRFRLGPLFEYRATRAGGTFWALRPFYSKVSDPVSDNTVTDVAWPLCTFHRDKERLWWRIMLAYGFNDDLNDRDKSWSNAILPFWFQGRTREGDDYWAFFPFRGRLPHMFFANEVKFTLFPFYVNYELNGYERTYTPWPLHSRVSRNSHLSEAGVFPFWSSQHNSKTQIDRRYAFWPIWTSTVYHGERNPGTSALLFPLYGKVDRARERQWLALPPFFSHAQTDSANRWRMPWPFYETLETFDTRTTKAAFKRSYWPFYGSDNADGDLRRYAAWPIYWSSTVHSKGRRAERRRVFPFYTDETIYKIDSQGVETQTERYTRVWPLYAREATPGESRLRVLELNLIRHSGAIERNWAPFWTLYERQQLPSGKVRHDLLWGIANWSVN